MMARCAPFCGLLALLGCPTPPVPPDPLGAIPPAGVVAFQGRTVDLRAHLEGFPYEPVALDPRANQLLVDHTGERRTLTAVALDATDPASGVPIGDTDWDSRTRWSVRWHDASHSWLFLGDTNNDERLNLWRLDPTTGASTVLTDEAYTYGYSVAADGRIAIVPRRPGAAPGDYRSCVEVLDPTGTQRTPIVCDGGDARLTWSDPAWAPDGRGLVVSVDLHGRRDRGNVAYVPFDHPELRIVTEPSAARTDAWALRDWLDPHTFVYVTDESGKDALWAYDVDRGVGRRIVESDRDIADAIVLDGRLVAVLHRPDGDAVAVYDAATGKETARVAVGGTIEVLADDHARTVWLSTASGTSPFGVQKLAIADDGTAALVPWLGVPSEVRDHLVRCEQKPVSFPTWDTDPATGAPRQFHAFLYVPKDGPPPAQAIVRMQTFYGGDDEWNTDTQVFCDAGITTFSPAVRGSDGYGRAFGALNDGDLGGNEIVDLFAAARWLESQGYGRGHIGVFGRSHGGYAAMRALTFPPGTNGHTDDLYPFAFGLADAGFSNILTFYAATNIPDWVVLEAGDPVKDRDKLEDRSPLAHLDQINAPLLLVHGTNDNRVPVAESRQMATACAAANKPCTFVEVPGQGHHVNGLADQVRVYSAKLQFLEDNVPTK